MHIGGLFGTTDISFGLTDDQYGTTDDSFHPTVILFGLADTYYTKAQ